MSHDDGVTPPLLALDGIVKRFGGNAAVNDVSLSVRAGRVVALLGENGAGKSTLIKALAGVHQLDGGSISLDGRRIGSAADFAGSGETPITFIHQDLGLIDWMTVAENMAFTMGFPRRLGLINWRRARLDAAAALARVGMELDPDARVFELSRTEKSLLAIARAVSVKARVLVLDEPTASLPAADVRRLFSVLNRLRSEGVGMIYVTHRLDEVMEIADDVAVMRDGRKVAEGERSRYTVRDLVRLIVGREKDGGGRSGPRPGGGECALEAEDLRVGDAGPVSFRLRRGEMLALSGLRGAGQEEIARALFGLRPITSGRILLHGRDFRPASPAEAMGGGVGLLAGDRLGESLVISMTVGENMFLNPTAQGRSLLGLRGPAAEAAQARRLVREFDVRPPLADIDVSALSGGNQQKVVLARWLSVPGKVLILEDPTAGVDVGARSDIYRLLDQALNRGLAALLVSSDFEETARLVSRAVIFNRGRAAAELAGDAVTFSGLLELASSAAPGSASR